MIIDQNSLSMMIAKKFHSF